MGNQQDILNQLKAVLDTSEVSPFESNTTRSSDDRSFIDFLFELVQQTKGQQEFKNIIFKGILGQLKDNTDIEKQIFNILNKEFFCEFDFKIPKDLTTKTTNGISVLKSEIDPFNLLKIDPESDIGKLTYEGNNINKHPNYFIKKSFEVDKSSSLDWKYSDRTLFNLYSNVSNELIFRFGEEYDGQYFSAWSEDYFNSIDFFNLPNFITFLGEVLTGVVSTKSNNTPQEIEEKNSIIQALKKLFGFCDETELDNDEETVRNSPLNNARSQRQQNNQTPTNDDSFPFNFSEDDLLDIDNETFLKNNNLLRFRTCDNIEIPVSEDEFVDKLNNIFITFGNGVDNENVDTDLDAASNAFDDIIANGTKQKIEAGERQLNVDFDNMQSELQLNILKAIPYALYKMILSPKMMLYVKIASFLNNEEETVSTRNVISKLDNVISQIGETITQTILAEIFNYLKKELGKLIQALIQRFLLQRALDYASVLAFLGSLIGDIGDDTKKCSSILDSLLQILQLTSITPMPSVPPPIVLGAGAFKPGLNEVSTINNLKSKLQEKGIETGPTYTDGTPNYFMYALESVVSVMIQDIKIRSKIDVTTIGLSGPTTGFGQIQ